MPAVTRLPPDETNGNTPLVSAHEVAWYAWTVTKDPHRPELIAAGEVKNMIGSLLSDAGAGGNRSRPISEL